MPQTQKSLSRSRELPCQSGAGKPKKVVAMSTPVVALNAENDPGRQALAGSGEPGGGTTWEMAAVLGWMRHRAEAGDRAQRSEVAVWAVLRNKIFLTVGEAAQFSGLPVATIRRLVRREALPAVKLGGGWRIKRKYVELLDLRHLRKVSEPPLPDEGRGKTPRLRASAAGSAGD